MAYRCKCCGYWFRHSDSDLCPECFTARDDISCLDFSDGGKAHSHGRFEDADSGDDFLARQIREESRLSGDELLEEMRGYTDAARRSFGSETPPNTYANSSYRPNTAPPLTYTSPTRSNTAPPMRAVSTSAGFQQRQAQRLYYDRTAAAAAADEQRKKNNKLIAPIIIVVFMVPILMEFLPNLIDFVKEIFDDATSSKVVTFPGGELKMNVDSPDYAAEDDLSGALDSYSFIGNYYEADSAAEDCDIKRLSGPSDVPESIWHCLSANISLNDVDASIDTVILTGLDGNNVVFEWEVVNDRYGEYNVAFGVPLIFNENVPDYTLDVLTTDDSGSEKTLTFKMSYSHLAEKAGDKLDEEPHREETVFSYDYSMGEFSVSMTDKNEGSNMSLRISGIPHEITPEELGNSIHLEDSGLPSDSSEWKMIPAMLVNRTTNAATAPSDHISCLLLALDADSQVSYRYDGKGPLEFPICSRVQTYELFVTFIFDDAYHTTQYAFTTNDLYDTASRKTVPPQARRDGF